MSAWDKLSGWERAREMRKLSWYAVHGPQRDRYRAAEGVWSCLLQAEVTQRRDARGGDGSRETSEHRAEAIGYYAGRAYWHADRLEEMR